ncbi:MAG: sulfotransferase [Pseudomonadota bacterium]
MILGVGAQKSGTSWLFRYLADHPAIFGSPLKELHFFNAWYKPHLCGNYDDLFRATLARADTVKGRLLDRERVQALRERVAMIEDRDAYLRFFASRIRDEAFMTEFSPCYSLLNAKHFARIREYFAEADVTVKPVFLMREPVERHYSDQRMRARDSKGTHNAQARFIRSLDTSAFYRRGRYDRTIRGLWEAFGRDNVSITFYENLFDNPDRWLRAITDFIGVDYLPPDTERRINASPRPDDLTEEQTTIARNRFRKVYAFIDEHFVADKPASWAT